MSCREDMHVGKVEVGILHLQ